MGPQDYWTTDNRTFGKCSNLETGVRQPQRTHGSQRGENEPRNTPNTRKRNRKAFPACFRVFRVFRGCSCRYDSGLAAPCSLWFNCALSISLLPTPIPVYGPLVLISGLTSRLCAFAVQIYRRQRRKQRIGLVVVCGPWSHKSRGLRGFFSRHLPSHACPSVVRIRTQRSDIRGRKSFHQPQKNAWIAKKETHQRAVF
jgi:hypothetical protein